MSKLELNDNSTKTLRVNNCENKWPYINMVIYVNLK